MTARGRHIVTTIRAAITQTTWTGNKTPMLDKHEQFARDAKAQEAQVICFQELFYGPYVGITEDAKYHWLRGRRCVGRW
jgi:beta-ureidopropionase